MDPHQHHTVTDLSSWLLINIMFHILVRHHNGSTSSLGISIIIRPPLQYHGPTSSSSWWSLKYNQIPSISSNISIIAPHHPHGSILSASRSWLHIIIIMVPQPHPAPHSHGIDRRSRHHHGPTAVAPHHHDQQHHRHATSSWLHTLIMAPHHHHHHHGSTSSWLHTVIVMAPHHHHGHTSSSWPHSIIMALHHHGSTPSSGLHIIIMAPHPHHGYTLSASWLRMLILAPQPRQISSNTINIIKYHQISAS